MSTNGRPAAVHIALGTRDELAAVAAALGCELADVLAVIVRADGTATALWQTGGDGSAAARLRRARLTWNFAHRLVAGPRVELEPADLAAELSL